VTLPIGWRVAFEEQLASITTYTMTLILVPVLLFIGEEITAVFGRSQALYPGHPFSPPRLNNLQAFDYLF